MTRHKVKIHQNKYEKDVKVKTEAKLDTVDNLGEKGEYFEHDIIKSEIKSEDW